MTDHFVPRCGICGRERDPLNRPADANAYTPFQAITGQPFGWYSEEDGETCPECMEEILR